MNNMKKPYLTISLIFIGFLVFNFNSLVIAQTTESDSSLTNEEVVELRQRIKIRVEIIKRTFINSFLK
jgi:hypothetical protein